MAPFTLSFTLLLATFFGSSIGQTSKLFQWGFSNTDLSTSLPTCLSLPIIVKSFDPVKNNTRGTPTYYMIAIPVDGPPVTSLIGTEETNLSWTVTLPIAGSTTTCIAKPVATPEFKITANVTGDLQTCQPWGLRIQGGVLPYIITLASPNSPVVTNVTIPFGDDAFTYINRADPGGQLIGAISDLTGRWATGTPIIKTKGSSDTLCVGFVSSTGNATLIQQEPNSEPIAASAKKRLRQIVITAVSVILVLLLLMITSLAGYIFRQRRKYRFSAQFIEVKPVIDPLNLSSYSDGKWVAFYSEGTRNIYGTVISLPAITTDTPGETIHVSKRHFLFPSFPPPQAIKPAHSVTLTYPPGSGMQPSASRANVAGFKTFLVSPLRRHDQHTPSDMPSPAAIIDTSAWQNRQNRQVRLSRNLLTDGGMYDISSLPPPPYI